MKISDLSAAHLTEMRQTLSMNLLKSSQATAIAQAVTMLDDFQKTQKVVADQLVKPVPHPYAGQSVDVKV